MEHRAPQNVCATPASPSWTRALWITAMLVSAAPLWLARDLPMVDLPQHLYLLDVIHRLHDPATLYPVTFASEFRFTPYLGYYAVMSWLHVAFSLETANRLFVSATVIGLPISTAFLLRSLGRPAWPALLTVSVAYGDNFGWGFVNTCAAIPLALVTLGAFVRAIAQRRRRSRWTLVFSLSMLVGFLMHPAPTLFLLPALPITLLMTRAEDDDAVGRAAMWWRRRLGVLAGMAPCLFAAGLWLWVFAAQSPELQPGRERASWGQILSSGMIVWTSPYTNMRSMLLRSACLLKNHSDLLAFALAFLVATAAIVCHRLERAPTQWLHPHERLRAWAFALIALGLVLFLPLHVPGVVQMLNPRLAPLAIALLTAVIPCGGPRSMRWLVAAAGTTALVLGITLAVGFRRFDREAAELRRISAAATARPLVMGLIFQPGSRVARHPVYLHAAAVLARLKGGVPNYSLAGWQQVSLRYRGMGPPGLPSEWRPDRFDYATMGPVYDHFLVRGASPDSLFGSRLGRELEIVAHEGDWWLVHRIGPAAAAR